MSALTTSSSSSSKTWLWVGGVFVVGTLAGIGALFSTAATSTKPSGTKPASGTPPSSGTPPPDDTPKPADLEGWPFNVAAGSTPIGFSPRFRFYRTTPPNPLGPIVWVLHGADTDARKLAPWIPSNLADVVFVQATDGWAAAVPGPDPVAAVGKVLDDVALQGLIPGPYAGGKQTRPWVVVGYGLGGEVALKMAQGQPGHVPNAVVSAAAVAPVTSPGSEWIAFLVGDKDTTLTVAEVEGAAQTYAANGFKTAVRVVAGGTHELASLGPQLRDLLLDVFTMFPHPT